MDHMPLLVIGIAMRQVFACKGTLFAYGCMVVLICFP